MTATIASIARGRHGFLGWRIAVLATIAAALSGPGQTIGVSVFVDPMIGALGLTRSEVSTAYLIGTLVGAVALLPVGRWIDRAGTSRAMAVIGLAFGAGLAFMSSIAGFLMLAIGFTLIRWLGQGSLSLVGQLSITPWFERRRGFVFGLSTTATVTLMALTPIFLGAAIEAFDWRFAWILAALAVWFIVIPIARFGIVDRPADVGQYPDGDAAPVDDGRDTPVLPSRTRREALVQVRFWLLSSSVAATAMLVTALNFHQISILGAQGLSTTQAAVMFLPQVAGAIIVGIVVGSLADRVPVRFLLLLSMALLAGSLLLVSSIAPGWHVVVYAIALGAATGAQRPLVATALPRWYGLAHVGAIQGASMTLAVAASAMGPVVLSLLRDQLGGYAPAALVLVAIPATIGIATLAVTEPRPLTSEDAGTAG